MDSKQKVLKYLLQFGILAGLFFVIIVISVLTAAYSPDSQKYSNDSFDWSYTPDYNDTEFNIVFDHHSHTKYSDGHLTVEQNVLWHLAHGFNAITISDHNTLKNADDIEAIKTKYAGQMIFIPGFEWTTGRIHMNLLGISEMIPVKNNPSDQDIIDTIDATHALGGVVVVDHIPWSTPRMPNHPSRAQLLAWGVDYIELVNEDIYDDESESWCNDTGGFGSITGTDMHDPLNVHGWTLMNADNYTTEGVMQELLNRNTTIIFDELGSKDQSIGVNNPVYTIFKPIIFTGNYFYNDSVSGGFINWTSFGIAYVYLTLGFVLLESTKFGVKKLRERLQEKKSASKNEEDL